MKNQSKTKNEHLAKASANNISISPKHSIELCRHLRYKTTSQAKKILEDVITLKKPIPFKRFKKDIGHKPGMAAGRFPQKAAREMLKLVKSVETNAQFKGLNTSNLKITKSLANKATTPMTGGRQRTGTKRANLEIEVQETKEMKSRKQKLQEKEKPKPEEAKEKTEEEKPTQKTKEESEKPIEEKPITEGEKKQEMLKEEKIEQKQTEGKQENDRT